VDETHWYLPKLARRFAPEERHVYSFQEKEVRRPAFRRQRF
jgi:hypothetical protein